MEFEKFITEKNCPIIFNNMVSHWPAREWNPQCLSDILKEKIIRCKIGPKFQGALFETECLYLDVTLADFESWCEGRDQTDNPLSKVDRDKYFCYVDYKYMNDLFEDYPQMLTQCVDWSCFGLDNRNGKDSTIWIGAEGSTTPCHYDTYGFNLVAQIYGRKRWFLFPPSDSKNMYSTRIPYEESSVYSEVNIKQPDAELHPNFKTCHPYIVTLEVGQVLYVPRHWWHYVECLETSVSINTWVEMVDDKNTRIEEAMTRILLSSLVFNLKDCVQTQQWINPNEELQNMPMNVIYLKKAVTDLEEKSNEAINNFQLFCDKFKTYCVFIRNYNVLTCDRKSNLIHPTRKSIKRRFDDLNFGDSDIMRSSESALHTRMRNIVEQSNLIHPTRKRINLRLDDFNFGGCDSVVIMTSDSENIDKNNISSCDRKNLNPPTRKRIKPTLDDINFGDGDKKPNIVNEANIVPPISIKQKPKQTEGVVHMGKMDNLNYKSTSNSNSICLEQVRSCTFQEYLELLNVEHEISKQDVKISEIKSNDSRARQLVKHETPKHDVKPNNKISEINSNDNMAKQLLKSVLNPKIIKQISDSFVNSILK